MITRCWGMYKRRKCYVMGWGRVSPTENPRSITCTWFFFILYFLSSKLSYTNLNEICDSFFILFLMETTPHKALFILASSRLTALDAGSLSHSGQAEEAEKIPVNYKYGKTFLCELCLSSAPCSQMVLGRLSLYELPWLIVKHVPVNQADPKWQLLSRHHNELPKPL